MAYSGGCQCGRVRYRAEGEPAHASVCYCRMCQRASGQPFMAFARFKADAVSWSTPPEVFASSNLVERGFCRECGTPLTYRVVSGPNLSVALNSLDDPSAVRPTVRFSPERKPDWLDHLDEMVEKTMDFTGLPELVSRQAEPSD